MASPKEISALFQKQSGQLISELQEDNVEFVQQQLQKVLLSLHAASATYADWMSHATDIPQQSLDLQRRQLVHLEQAITNAAVAGADPFTKELAEDAAKVHLAFVESGEQLNEITLALSKQLVERVGKSFATLLKGSGSWESFVEAIKLAVGIGVGFIPIIGDAAGAIRDTVEFFRRSRVRRQHTNEHLRSLEESTESYTGWALLLEMIIDLRTHPPDEPITSIHDMLSGDRMIRAQAILKKRFEDIEKSWTAQ